MNSFRHLHQPTGRNISIDKQDYLFFGGTAYLGLLVNEEYLSLVQKGINLYGLNNGTSRSNNVQLGIYDEAEKIMASRFGYDDSVLFSSGYLAAQATVKALATLGKVYYAPNSHPALWIADKPHVLADDFKEWIDSLIATINASAEKDFVVVANALDNLKPELYDFSPLSRIDGSKNVLLILDDSHGLGIVKKNDISVNVEGLSDCNNIQIIVVASLAKGLGTDAGIVFGNKELIAKVKQSPIFMGASPSSPGFIYALIHSDSIYNEAYHSLHNNIELFASSLDARFELNSAKDFPVFTSNDPMLYKRMCKNDVLISSFPYPLSSSPLLNRIVISALHTTQDIQKLTHVLHSVFQ